MRVTCCFFLFCIILQSSGVKEVFLFAPPGPGNGCTNQKRQARSLDHYDFPGIGVEFQALLDFHLVFTKHSEVEGSPKIIIPTL